MAITFHKDKIKNLLNCSETSWSWFHWLLWSLENEVAFIHLGLIMAPSTLYAISKAESSTKLGTKTCASGLTVK